MDGSVLRADRLRAALDSAVVGLLLFSVVASAVAGAEAALYATVLAANPGPWSRLCV